MEPPPCVRARQTADLGRTFKEYDRHPFASELNGRDEPAQAAADDDDSS
jgi:hypothetical protein